MKSVAAIWAQVLNSLQHPLSSCTASEMALSEDSMAKWPNSPFCVDCLHPVEFHQSNLLKISGLSRRSASLSGLDTTAVGLSQERIQQLYQQYSYSKSFIYLIRFFDHCTPVNWIFKLCVFTSFVNVGFSPPKSANILFSVNLTKGLYQSCGAFWSVDWRDVGQV